MKSYTDLEQSKKLAEFLPLESADYCWGIDYESRYLNFNSLPYTRPYNTYENDEDFIPCWSLVALLSVIPNYRLNSEHNYHTCTAETSFGKESVGWYVNPIDACVGMILKLHELNLL